MGIRITKVWECWGRGHFRLDSVFRGYLSWVCVFIQNWKKKKEVNSIRSFGAAHALMSAAHFSHPATVFLDNQLSFVAWFMWWLILRHRKLGKMFSAPSHAVRGKGCDLERADLRVLWREEGGSNRARASATWVSAECEGPRGSGKISFFFKVYFSTCWGMEGCWFSGLKKKIKKPNNLENKHTVTERHTVSLS